MPRKKSAAKKARESVSDSNELNKYDNKLSKAKEDEEPVSDEDSELSESSEDENGDLITEDVESGIQNVLKALKSDPKSLLNPNNKFFDDPEKASKLKKASTEKPLYLKDYHRINLLSGNGNIDEIENGELEKPPVELEREERDKLLSDIKNAFSDTENVGDDDEDDFIQKKEKDNSTKEDYRDNFPDPEKNSEAFLNAFVDNQAWVSRKNDKVINLDQIDKEDEEDFDDAVENYENAYNFRFEDPHAAEIVSYARNQATLRRDATNARKKHREKKREEKLKEKLEDEKKIKQKKKDKVNIIVDRLSQIREAVGEDIPKDVIERVFGESLLNDDFDDASWDDKMSEVFNEVYYNADSSKPQFDNDLSEKDEQEDVTQQLEIENNDGSKDEGLEKNSKKEKLKAKKSQRKAKNEIKENAQDLVESNTLKIMDELEEERGRKKERGLEFKYREVSPETFGLTTRDILFAGDKQLNEYIGVKKLASYRPREARMKDKRKYAKSKRLREWRKSVFKDEKTDNMEISTEKNKRHKK